MYVYVCVCDFVPTSPAVASRHYFYVGTEDDEVAELNRSDRFLENIPPGEKSRASPVPGRARRGRGGEGKAG